MGRFLLAVAFVALSAMALPAYAAPASGYWWNPAEPGRGFVIEIQGNQMFMAGFLYAASGEATWVASAGAMASPTQYSGSLITFQNGQTLSGPFKQATQVQPALGTLSIAFSSDTQGTLTWPGGTIPIQRYDFGPGGSAATQPSTNPQAGWWYNSLEGGRGYAVEVQGGSMYLAAYMYDNAGNTIWYLANGNMSSPGLFQGQWSQFGKGQTLTGAYKPPAVVNPGVAPVTLQFVDSTSAVLTLPNEQIRLSRYNFGVSAPTLSAFSAATAAPNSLLTVTGNGIDPTAVLSMTVFDNTGYSVTLPLAVATATSVKLSVPAYVSIAAKAFASGTVSLKLTQSKNGTSADSNALAGFNIQQLPAVPGTPGTSTLSLIRANLNEAQKLQTAIVGTAQDTPAVEAALAQQVTNLQALVANVQSVVLSGQSFTLGIVGGANIDVTPANIGQVDSFILATLESLANPPTGTTEKAAQAASTGCMGAEASAFATAMTSGSGNFDQLAQNLIEAPGASAACNTAAAFTSAYQIFGGAGSTGIGLTNQAGATGGANIAAGPALFATATTNANTAIGINALLSPQLATQTTAVQAGIGNVSALAKPITDQLLQTTQGALSANVSIAQNIILTVAPPPSTGGPLAVAGNYSGSATITSPASCAAVSTPTSLNAQVSTQGNTLSGVIQDTKGNGKGGVFTGSYNASIGNWSFSGTGTNDRGGAINFSGTISGALMSGSFTNGDSGDCPSQTDSGVFSLTKQ